MYHTISSYSQGPQKKVWIEWGGGEICPFVCGYFWNFLTLQSTLIKWTHNET